MDDIEGHNLPMRRVEHSLRRLLPKAVDFVIPRQQDKDVTGSGRLVRNGSIKLVRARSSGRAGA